MKRDVRTLTRKATALATAFMLTAVSVPHPAGAGELVVPVMPSPGTLVSLSPASVPAHIQGITVDPKDPLRFDFVIHRGDGRLDTGEKTREYTKLIKYFLASLTMPDTDQWVNLSPYERGRIIESNFGKTEMGRDLLAQDYLLKQITSSLMYPEKGLGKGFWDKVYAQAWAKYRTTNIPVNTFNKVWIVPDHATVYEHGNAAYILKSHLKVMLEEDYLAISNNVIPAKAGIHSKMDARLKHSGMTREVIRDVILPILEKEVNEGKNFAPLRQVVSSMVLATWYKKALKDSILTQVYADKSKVEGLLPTRGHVLTKTTKNVSPSRLPSNDGLNAKATQGADPFDVDAIYQRYLEAFKKGVYNYIKEDEDKYTHQPIARKYFAGGFNHGDVTTITDWAQVARDPALKDAAMQADAAVLDTVPVRLNAKAPFATSDMMLYDKNVAAFKSVDRAMVQASTPVAAPADKAQASAPQLAPAGQTFDDYIQAFAVGKSGKHIRVEMLVPMRLGAGLSTFKLNGKYYFEGEVASVSAPGAQFPFIKMRLNGSHSLIRLYKRDIAPEGIEVLIPPDPDGVVNDYEDALRLSVEKSLAAPPVLTEEEREALQKQLASLRDERHRFLLHVSLDRVDLPPVEDARVIALEYLWKRIEEIERVSEPTFYQRRELQILLEDRNAEWRGLMGYFGRAGRDAAMPPDKAMTVEDYIKGVNADPNLKKTPVRVYFGPKFELTHYSVHARPYFQLDSERKQYYLKDATLYSDPVHKVSAGTKALVFKLTTGFTITVFEAEIDSIIAPGLQLDITTIAALNKKLGELVGTKGFSSMSEIPVEVFLRKPRSGKKVVTMQRLDNAKTGYGVTVKVAGTSVDYMTPANTYIAVKFDGKDPEIMLRDADVYGFRVPTGDTAMTAALDWRAQDWSQDWSPSQWRLEYARQQAAAQRRPLRVLVVASDAERLAAMDAVLKDQVRVLNVQDGRQNVQVDVQAGAVALMPNAIKIMGPLMRWPWFVEGLGQIMRRRLFNVDQDFRAAANSMGIRNEALNAFKPRLVTAALVQAADIIIAADHTHFDFIAAHFGALTKTVLLKQFPSRANPSDHDLLQPAPDIKQKKEMVARVRGIAESFILPVLQQPRALPKNMVNTAVTVSWGGADYISLSVIPAERGGIRISRFMYRGDSIKLPGHDPMVLSSGEYVEFGWVGEKYAVRYKGTVWTLGTFGVVREVPGSAGNQFKLGRRISNEGGSLKIQLLRRSKALTRVTYGITPREVQVNRVLRVELLRPDAAQVSDPVGGIDLNAAHMDLSIKRDGAGVPLPVAAQDLARFDRLAGFVPHILGIRPAGHLPVLEQLQHALKSSP